MKEAILLTDGYKLDHRRQYPEGTEYVYSNWTPRSCHYYPEAKEGAVVFGIQYFIKEYLMKQFQEDFFNKPKDVAVAEFKRRVDTFLGPNNVGTKHIEELHDLGYLPIRIKALPEGTFLVLGVGSYTYQYKSRDSLGFAMKATWCQVNGEGREIFKDPKTGQLSGFKIENPEVIEKNVNLPFVVIDDLCDGGGTFKGIAQLLGFHYPDRERTIYVTHMVNPKGITTLSENYKEVYFTNSYKDWNKETLPDNVKVIEIV